MATYSLCTKLATAMNRWMVVVVCGAVVGYCLGIDYNVGSAWIASKGLNIDSGVWNQAKQIAEMSKK